MNRNVGMPGWHSVYLLASWVNIGVGGGILFRSPRNPANRLYFLLALAIAYVTYLSDLKIIAPTLEAAQAIRGFEWTWTFVIPFAAHLASQAFGLSGERVYRARNGFNYGFAAASIVLGVAWPDLAVDQPIRRAWGWELMAVGWLGNGTVAWASFMAFWNLLIAIRHFKKQRTETGRASAFYYLVGFAALFFSGMTYPIHFHLLPELSPPPMVLFLALSSLCFGYAMVRHQLFGGAFDHVSDALFTSSADAVLVVSDGGYIENANPAFTRSLGTGNQDPAGRALSSFLAMEDGKALERVTSLEGDRFARAGRVRLRSGRGPFMAKARLVEGKGEARWLLTLHDLANDETLGELRSEIAVQQTVRRNLEDQVAAQVRQAAVADRRIQNVLGTVMDPVFTIDESGLFSSWNPAAERLFGWQPREILSRHLSIVIPSCLGTLDQATIARATAGRFQALEGRLVELSAVSQAGEEIPVELSLSRWESDDGLRFTGVIRDIRERKRAERSLKLAVVGEMTGMIAHEINTPLAVISLNAEQVEEELESPEPSDEVIRSKLGAIREVCGRITRLIRSMRTYFKDQDQTPLQDFDVADSVNDAVSLVRNRALYKGVRMNLANTLADAGAKVRGRSGEVVQVLVNLLGNSIDAVSGQPGAWVEIGIQRNAGQVEIRVTDSGSGIPKEIARRLFEPYFTTKGDEGSGFGLTFCRRVAERHGGSLRYDGECRNTRFVMALPIIEPASGEEAA